MTHYDLAVYSRNIYAGAGACGGEVVESDGLVAEVVRDHSDVVLVIRGTPGASIDCTWEEILEWIRNWAYNLHAWEKIAIQFGHVHAGFGDAWQRLAPKVMPLLDSIIGGGAGEHLTITGHSLGGAIANVAASDLWSYGIKQVVTFGAPRTGDGEFRKSWDEIGLAQKTTRYHYACDPVALIPWKLRGYTHTTPATWWDGRSWRQNVGVWSYLRQVVHRLSSWIWDHHIDNYITALSTQQRPSMMIRAPYKSFDMYKLLQFGVEGRSSSWPRVRKAHLLKYPACAACGAASYLEVHHVKPFHLFPECELDENNLITLCESPTHNCHLIFGHLLLWSSWNKDVRQDAEDYWHKMKNRPTAA